MDEDIALPFDLPAVARKKVSAAFDGGRITSDGGVMLLAQAERRLGVAERLAAVMPDGRDASRVIHLLPDILRARIFAIACGYEDADDLDRLRSDRSLVGLTTLVMAMTVARGRRTLLEAVVAARRSANLSQYFPSGLLPLLAEADVEALKHGRRQDAAILFADIRGFTALSGSLDPKAIAEFLGSFRCRAMRAIEAHGGIVDKFVGDDVMGVFGVPISTAEDAANALAAGRALQAEIAAWNEKRRYAGRRPVSIGIGIHYGQVFAGVIEGGKRLEFTVIGDAVNTTHRIEELTKTAGWSLLVSAELLGAAKPPCPSRDCHPLPAQIVRGLKEPLHLFALVSADESPKPAYG